MKSKTLTKLGKLLNQTSFTAQDARERGVSPSLLAYYIANGQIQKLDRGVYRGTGDNLKKVPFEWEDLIATAQSISEGVVCLISALSIYELTDEMPRQFWIAVSNDSRSPKRSQTKIVRFRDIKTGATQLQLGEVKIKIFNRERTIVDAFRYLSKEIAIKALRRYLEGKGHKPDIKKLYSYSKKLRVPLKKYIEALTT